jgi:hypothetical protein
MRLGKRQNWASTWAESSKSFTKSLFLDLELRFFLKILFGQLKLFNDKTRFKKSSKISRSSEKIVSSDNVTSKWYSYLQSIPEKPKLLREKNYDNQNKHVEYLSPFFHSHIFEYCEHTEKTPYNRCYQYKKHNFLPNFSAQLFSNYITKQISFSTSFKDLTFNYGFSNAIKKIARKFAKKQKLGTVSGIKIVCSGKWKKTKSGRSLKTVVSVGRLQSQSIRALTSYGFGTSVTKFGCCGLKVWLNYKPLISLIP